MIKTPSSTAIGGAFWTPSATIIGGTSKTLDQLIKPLFANNEQGFFYDPNDLTTMFQDAAGTVPVTAAGQPVGLIKDKSGRGNHASQTTSAARPIFRQNHILGSELVVNGDFSNGTTGWSSSGCTFTVEDGFAKLVATGGVPARIQRTITTEIGKIYRLSLLVRKPSGIGASVGAWVTGASTPYSRSAQWVLLGVDFTAKATSSTINADIGGAVTAGEFAHIDNVSVKEIKGYRTDQNYIEYDKVNDKLITILPAQLTGCTVIRSVPNVGTQILTGQTIPTTYNDNTDHCGLIVINRALTATETSQITRLFNKAAGV